MTTWRVDKPKDMTLVLCDWCHRGYPAHEMLPIVSGTGLTHWYRYKCRECQGQGPEDGDG